MSKENKWRPDIDAITGRKFFMWLEHPELGYVPTYGGPLDSYTLAEKDCNGEFFVHRYDHDFGGWVDDECVCCEIVDYADLPLIEGKHLLSALQQLLEIYDDQSGKVWTTSSKRRALDNAREAVNKALGETK